MIRIQVNGEPTWSPEGLDLRETLLHLGYQPALVVVELNGGVETLAACRSHLDLVDGVMVGRAAYQHPLRWAEIDKVIFEREADVLPSPSTVVRGVIPHAERWCGQGGRLWAIGRHLVHLVEGVKGARGWRANLSRQAGQRNAGPEVLAQAALQLEERGL